MTKYNLPDEGSKQWHDSPLFPAVADLDKRVVRTERRGLLNEDDIAAAAELAAAAQAAALAAMAAAEAAQAIADGAIRTYYAASPPWADGSPQPDANIGDLWFQTTTGLAHRWDGDSWELIQDASITEALDAAQNAQTTADGKITAYYQAAQPWADADPAHDEDVGDLWFDTDDQNKPYYYDGTFWTEVRDGTIADAAADAATAQAAADAAAADAAAAQAAADAAAAAAGTDGNPPASSPTPVAEAGPGMAFIRWAPVANADPVKFRLYGDTTAGFTAGPGNLLITTASSSYTHRPLPPDYSATYYYKVVEFDADGDAAISAEASTQLAQVNFPDVVANFGSFLQLSVDQLTTGTLTAGMALASTISTRFEGTGAGVDLNVDGVSIFDSAGQPATLLGPEGSTFKGRIESDGATFTGGVSLRSPLTEISRGGVVTMASGVTAPQQAPSVLIDWESLALPTANHGMGLVWLSGKWWTAEWSGATGYFVSYDPGTGAEVDRIAQTGLAVPNIPGGGLAWNGTNWYTLGQSLADGKWYLIRWSNLGVFMNGSEYTLLDTDNGWSYEQYNISKMSIAYRPSTGNIVIAQYDTSSAAYSLDHRDPTTCAHVSYSFTPNVTGFVPPVGGVAFGNFDYGSERMALTSRNNGNIWIFNPATSYSYSAAESFPAASGMTTGVAYDGTNFFVARIFPDAHSAIYKHTTHTWTSAADGNWWVPFTWYDSNATGGLHETTMSPVANFTMKKRARFTLTAPAIPVGGSDDPNTVRFFLGKGSSLPARTAMYLQGSAGAQSQTFTVPTFSGTNPPASGNYPVGTTPGLTQSAAVATDAAPMFWVDGAGSGRWVGEGWHAVGGLGEPAFALGSSLANYPVSFRKDPLGNVRLTGIWVYGSLLQNTTSFGIFTLPTNYWPLQADEASWLVFANPAGTIGQITVRKSTGLVVFRRLGQFGTAANPTNVQIDGGFSTR